MPQWNGFSNLCANSVESIHRPIHHHPIEHLTELILYKVSAVTRWHSPLRKKRKNTERDEPSPAYLPKNLRRLIGQMVSNPNPRVIKHQTERVPNSSNAIGTAETLLLTNDTQSRPHISEAIKQCLLTINLSHNRISRVGSSCLGSQCSQLQLQFHSRVNLQ